MTDTTTPFTNVLPRSLFDDDPTPFGKQYRPRYTPRRRRFDDTITTYLDEVLADAESRTPASTDLFAERLAPSGAAPDAGNDPVGDALRSRAVAAIDDLCDVLGLANSNASKLAGVARNTLASWRRRERVPYPATVRHLFEVHSVVAAAAALFGRDGARGWFHGHLPDGDLRLAMLGTSNGPARLTEELRSQLFPPARTSGLPDVLDDDDVVADDDVYAPEQFAREPRRRPKVP